MNKLKIFKNLIRICTHVDLSQKSDLICIPVPYHLAIAP